VLIYVLAGLAAAQAAPSASNDPSAQAPTAAPAPAPAKRKHKPRQKCDTDQASIGSHIIMDTCPTAEQLQDETTRSVIDVQQSSTAGPGPH